MRKKFFEFLYEKMSINENIWALTGDLGYGGFDRIQKEFPERFINFQAAEFSMLASACGLALSGKKPVVYSITPFLLYRPFEILRTYVNHEKIPVKLIGAGRDDDYKHCGISHFSFDSKKILDTLDAIKQYWPNDINELSNNVNDIIDNDKPCFLSLKR